LLFEKAIRSYNILISLFPFALLFLLSNRITYEKGETIFITMTAASRIVIKTFYSFFTFLFASYCFSLIVFHLIALGLCFNGFLI